MSPAIIDKVHAENAAKDRLLALYQNERLYEAAQWGLADLLRGGPGVTRDELKRK